MENKDFYPEYKIEEQSRRQEQYEVLSRELTADVYPLITHLSDPLQSLGNYVDGILQDVYQQQKRIRQGEISFDEAQHHVVFGLGRPGSSKTTSLNAIATQCRLFDIQPGFVEWERGQSEVGGPTTRSTRAQLTSINYSVESILTQELMSKLIVLVELPAATAIIKSGPVPHWQGRLLGQPVISGAKNFFSQTQLPVQFNIINLSPDIGIQYLAVPQRTQGAPESVVLDHSRDQMGLVADLFKEVSLLELPPEIVLGVLSDDPEYNNPFLYAGFEEEYGAGIDAILTHMHHLEPYLRQKSKIVSQVLHKSPHDQRIFMAQEKVRAYAGAWMLDRVAEKAFRLPREQVFNGLVSPPPEKILGLPLPESYRQQVYGLEMKNKEIMGEEKNKDE